MSDMRMKHHMPRSNIYQLHHITYITAKSLSVFYFNNFIHLNKELFADTMNA